MNVWLDRLAFAFRETGGADQDFGAWGLVDEGCCNIPGNVTELSILLGAKML